MKHNIIPSCKFKQGLIRTLLFVCLISLSHLSKAQTNCPDLMNWPLTGQDTLYKDLFGYAGYPAGHNASPGPATAQFISNIDTIGVSGTLIWFGHAETADTTSIITITIWDSSGTDFGGNPGAPGNILYTKDILIIDIVQDVADSVLTEVTFDSVVTLTEGFYMGIQVTNAAGDTVGIVSNRHGDDTVTTAWGLYPTFGGWYNFQDGWLLDVSLAIFPITTLSPGFTQTADTIDVGSPVTFTDTTTTNGAISWYWWFGDGDTSIAMNPVHIYDSSGTYTVKLAVTVMFAGWDTICTDTVWGTVTVICPAFSAGFTQTPNTVYVGSPVTFTDTTTGATGWYWWFGDGDTSTAMSPTHTYDTAGTYSIKLVTWKGACTDTVWDIVTVICPAFSAGFTQNPDTAVVGSPVTFTDTTTGATGWYWWFGDGDTSTAMSPMHTYDTAGTYSIKLVAWKWSCPDTVMSTITVLDTVTGIDELTNAGALSIYPNPTEGILYVMFDVRQLKPISIKVLNTVGKLVFETDNKHNLTSGNCMIDLSNKASGTYLVQIVTKDGVIFRKISTVKQ